MEGVRFSQFMQISVIIGLIIIYIWTSHRKYNQYTPFQTIEGPIIDTDLSLPMTGDGEEIDVIARLQAQETELCVVCLVSCLRSLKRTESRSPLHAAAIASCIEMIEGQEADWKVTVGGRLSRMGLSPVMICTHNDTVRKRSPPRRILLPQAPMRIPSYWNSSEWQNWSSSQPHE